MGFNSAFKGSMLVILMST